MVLMTGPFYHTVMSHSSRHLYPNNTPNNFSIVLPYPFEFGGIWDVGVAEAHHPMGFKDNQDNNISRVPRAVDVERCKFNQRKEVRELVKSGRLDYRDKETELENRYVERCGVTPKPMDTGRSDVVPMEVDEPKIIMAADEFTAQTQRFTQRITELEKINKQLTSSNNHLVKDVVDLFTSHRDNSNAPGYLYMYSDIATYTHVGDKFAPFMRMIRVPPLQSGVFTESHVFNPIFYYRLAKTRLDKIEVDIRDEHDGKVAFAGGISALTFHFRPANQSHSQ